MALSFKHHATLILACGILLSACLTEPEVYNEYDGIVPVPLSDGWPISVPEDQGFDPAKLDNVFSRVRSDEHWQMKSLLVFRNGHLVAEDYLKDDEDILRQRAIWSATKQVLAVVVGIAVDQGVIASVSDPISNYLPEVNDRYPDKAEITIEDLLHMRSGIAYSNDDASGETSHMLRKIPANSLDFILSLPMANEPGTTSAYKDGDPHLLSLILQRQTGMPLDEWADQNLFQAIGFTNYTWVRYRDGSTLGAFGILTTPREMAKIAQLVLNDGQWNGQQIVTASWVSEMTAPRVDSYSDRYSFGYQWWYENEFGYSFMNGHGGQYAIIDMSSQIVMVMTAEPNTQGDNQIDPEFAIDLFGHVKATLDG